LGYIRGRERKKNAKETKGESPSMARFVLITGKGRKALEFQAIGGGKNAWFPWKWAIG
jgi:hypothetical protein